MSVSVETFVCTDGSEAQVVRTNDGRVFSLSRSPIKGLDYEIPASISNTFRSQDPSFKIIDVAKHVEALKEHQKEGYRRRSWKEVHDGKQDLFLSSFTFSNGVSVPVLRGNHRVAFVKVYNLKKAKIIGSRQANKTDKSDGERFNVHALFHHMVGRNALVLHVERLLELYGTSYPIMRELLEDEQEDVIIPMPRKRSHESQSEEAPKKSKTSFGNTDIDAIIETTVQEQVKAVFQTREIQDAIKERILKALK